jgi:CRISPR/Cas system CSM-associated protein Csm5 (group 7 of RAMP superfamily)
MNERINELINQSYLNVQSQSGRDVTYFDKEYFAELIVKECTNYMNSRTEDWDAKLRWIFNDGSGYMEVDVGSILKEHFGMSE